MKKLLALLLLLSLFTPTAFAADEQYVYNCTKNLTEEYVFPEDTPILEVFFPRVFNSDCAIVRFGDEVVMIDAPLSATGCATASTPR